MRVAKRSRTRHKLTHTDGVPRLHSGPGVDPGNDGAAGQVSDPVAGRGVRMKGFKPLTF